MSARPAAPPAGVWFTSSYSNEGNGCVQVRFDTDAVQVADSKQHGRGPVIRVSRAGWDAFVATTLGRPRLAADAPRGAPDGRDGWTITGPDATVLQFTAQEWSAFLAGAADGEFTAAA